jgi:hypothetical protein
VAEPTTGLLSSGYRARKMKVSDDAAIAVKSSRVGGGQCLASCGIKRWKAWRISSVTSVISKMNIGWLLFLDVIIV